jgi:hypothetical protein
MRVLRLPHACRGCPSVAHLIEAHFVACVHDARSICAVHSDARSLTMSGSAWRRWAHGRNDELHAHRDAIRQAAWLAVAQRQRAAHVYASERALQQLA